MRKFMVSTRTCNILGSTEEDLQAAVMRTCIFALSRDFDLNMLQF